MSSDEIIRILDELAVRLEGPAARVFELAVRQVFIESAVQLVLTTILLIVGVGLAIPIYRHLLRGYRDTHDGEYVGGIAIVSAASFIISIPLVCWIWEGLTQILNPEWVAIEKVAGLLP
jgi:hypothetical protein